MERLAAVWDAKRLMVESVGDKGRGLWVDCTDTIGSSLAVFVPESHLVLWGLEVDLVPVEEISVP